MASTEKSTAFLKFVSRTLQSDRRFLRDILSKFKNDECKQIDVLLYFLPVLNYMRSKSVKHSTFFTERGSNNRSMILDYLNFIENKQAPSWEGVIFKDINGNEFRSMGIVKYFEQNGNKKHRSTIVENTNILFKDLLEYVRLNQNISENLLKGDVEIPL